MYRRNGRGRLLLLVFVALSVLIITLDFRQNPGGPLQRVKDISGSVIAPIQRGFTAVARPVGDFFSSLSELNDARRENERLRAQIEQIESDIDNADALVEENARIRALLELEESWLNMERVNAEVIAEAPSNYKWAVLIDKGSAQGVRRDMAVVDPDGLVGKIIGVDKNYSTVLLLIDPAAAAGARVDEGRDKGLVRGNGADSDLSLEFIGTNASVEVGDRVITSGFDQGIFPPGIPIGTVTDVQTETAGVEKDVTLEPLVDFGALDFVSVILESGPKHRARRGTGK